jgi:all-trans-8'-apo-beta-carotenal 15,15'-oxygenase
MTIGPAIPRATADWSVALASLDEQNREPVELLIAGRLPDALAGTLYLVGPARHEVYGSRGTSLLDGDGMVHAVRLSVDPARATYQHRYVETRKKQKEDEAQRRVYATFGAPAPGGRLARLLRSRPGGTANAGVVAHDGRLFALWDGAPPHDTLETRGRCRFDGLLRKRDGFASSPVVDAAGDLWNVGGRVRGRGLRLGVYRWPAGGAVRLVASDRLPYPAVVRSFALTPSRLVFVLSPLVVRRPMTAVLGQRCLAELLEWRPELGSIIGLVDRDSGAFRWVPAPPMMVSSVVQAYDGDEGDEAGAGGAGGDVVIDVCTYPDAGMVAAATEVMGGTLRTQGYATLERLRVGADGHVERSLLPPLDWPCVAPPHTPGPDAKVYGINLNPLAGFPGTLAAVDVGTGRVDWVPPVAHEVAGPPVAVRKGPTGREAWVLSVVTDLVERRSELRVFDGEQVGSGPVFSAALPCVVPFGARGIWVGAGQ